MNENLEKVGVATEHTIGEGKWKHRTRAPPSSALLRPGSTGLQRQPDGDLPTVAPALVEQKIISRLSVLTRSSEYGAAFGMTCTT